jgi:hypothetical protein
MRRRIKGIEELEKALLVDAMKQPNYPAVILAKAGIHLHFYIRANG